MNRLLPASPNIAPRTVSEARKLIGKKVEFLREQDIDKSGRGYIFPQRGMVEAAAGRNVRIDGDWFYFTSIREMRDISAPPV